MSAYWSQWSSEELDSMHGIEPEDYRNDEEDIDPSDYMDEEECDEDEEYGEPVSMDSLGMSWSDFM